MYIERIGAKGGIRTKKPIRLLAKTLKITIDEYVGNN